MYKMKYMISEMRRGSTNKSPFWHKIFYVDSFVLQNLFALHTPLYDFFCLDPHCIAFQIFYISASDLNRFPRFCKSYVISMR